MDSKIIIQSVQWEEWSLQTVDLFSPFFPFYWFVLACFGASWEKWFYFLGYLCDFTQHVVSIGEITSTGTNVPRPHAQPQAQQRAGVWEKTMHSWINQRLPSDLLQKWIVALEVCVWGEGEGACIVFFPPHLVLPHCPEGNGNAFWRGEINESAKWQRHEEEEGALEGPQGSVGETIVPLMSSQCLLNRVVLSFHSRQSVRGNNKSAQHNENALIRLEGFASNWTVEFEGGRFCLLACVSLFVCVHACTEWYKRGILLQPARITGSPAWDVCTQPVVRNLSLLPVMGHSAASPKNNQHST